MLEIPSHNILKSRVQDWSQNTPIYRALLSKYNRSPLSQYNGLEKFSMSELYLCSALELLELPDGFIIPPSGMVETCNPDNAFEILDSVGHTFGLCGDFVMCITFGQFYGNQYPEAELKPGDRVAGYKQLAPNLITLLDHGIAVLHGRQKDIFDLLRLNYRT